MYQSSSFLCEVHKSTLQPPICTSDTTKRSALGVPVSPHSLFLCPSPHFEKTGHFVKVPVSGFFQKRKEKEREQTQVNRRVSEQLKLSVHTITMQAQYLNFPPFQVPRNFSWPARGISVGFGALRRPWVSNLLISPPRSITWNSRRSPKTVGNPTLFHRLSPTSG